MASATVMIVLKSATVGNNGATPDAFSKVPAPAQVAVLSSLEMQNGLQASQLASCMLPMSNNAPFTLDSTDVYDKGKGPVVPLQFKTRIEDQSPLAVGLSYTEKPDLFGQILVGVLSALGNTLAGLVPGGSFAQAAAGGLITLLGGKLKDASGKTIQPIGQGSLRVKVADLTDKPQEFRVALTAPDDVSRTWNMPNPDEEQRNNTPFVQVTRNVISKGQANGEVVLAI